MSRIEKAIKSWLNPGSSKVAKSARGTMGSFVPGEYTNYGQPPPVSANVDGIISPHRMREIIMKTPTAASCINAILDYAGGVKISLRNTDLTQKPSKKQVKRVNGLLRSPNPSQTGRQFLLALMRDIVTFGYGAIELEHDVNGGLANMWVMDAARVRVDFDEHGDISGYNELNARGVPIQGPDGKHGWEPDEVIFFSLNPMSESVYPYSRVSQIFSTALIEDLMMFFISGRFTESNAPYGIYDLGDINEDELEYAMTQWNAQANSQHRIILTGSKSGGKFIPFGYHLKDLDASGLLEVVRDKIMSVVGVTLNELGQGTESGKANGFNLSFTFKKRAIEPLLNEITETLTKRLLWDTLGFNEMEAYYDEIDTRDSVIQAQIDESYMKIGVWSRNDVANRMGMPDSPGGEVYAMFTGSSWVPLDLIEPLAENLMAIEQTATMGNLGSQDATDAIKLKVAPPGAPSPSALQKPEGKVHATRALSGSKDKPT